MSAPEKVDLNVHQIHHRCWCLHLITEVLSVFCGYYCDKEQKTSISSQDGQKCHTQNQTFQKHFVDIFHYYRHTSPTRMLMSASLFTFVFCWPLKVHNVDVIFVFDLVHVYLIQTTQFKRNRYIWLYNLFVSFAFLFKYSLCLLLFHLTVFYYQYVHICVEIDVQCSFLQIC